MAHSHAWTYFYVPGDAFRYCSCGARESVDPDGKSRPVTAKERGFVEGQIKKLEKKGNELYWQMAYGVLEKRANVPEDTGVPGWSWASDRWKSPLTYSYVDPRTGHRSIALPDSARRSFREVLDTFEPKTRADILSRSRKAGVRIPETQAEFFSLYSPPQEKRAASTTWLIPAGAAVGAGVQYLRYRDEDEERLHKHMMRGALLGGLAGTAVMGGVDERTANRNRKAQEALRAHHAAAQAQALTEANAVIAARSQALQAEHARRQATLPSNQAEFDAMMADPNHVFEF